MRDDELSRVPKSIEPWRVMEFLQSLGIEPKDTYETTIGVRQVTVRMYATDETGHRYVGEDGKRPAEHVVSIAYAGPWKRPESVTVEEAPFETQAPFEMRCPATKLGPDDVNYRCEQVPEHDGEHLARRENGRPLFWTEEDCPAREKRDGYTWQCAVPLGHAGEHSYRWNRGRILGDVPQA